VQPRNENPGYASDTVLPCQFTYRTPVTRLQALPQRQSVDKIRRQDRYDQLANYVVFAEAIMIAHLQTERVVNDLLERIA